MAMLLVSINPIAGSMPHLNCPLDVGPGQVRSDSSPVPTQTSRIHVADDVDDLLPNLTHEPVH